MVSVKKSTIFSRVFFSKTGQEIVLSYGLKRNEASEDDKNVNFLKSKTWVFFSKIGLKILEAMV